MRPDDDSSPQRADAAGATRAGIGVGSVISSKYRVDAVLGSGGMGIVFAATHLQLEERVAIKILRPESSTRSGAVERFVREARVAMKLRGEHAVRVHDVGTLADGSPFIVMEYLDGRDFQAVLREGKLAAAVAVDHVLQACEAIAEAHALGVIHRDLKPANLFLTERVYGSSCVKVLDFGVSKIGGVLGIFGDARINVSSDLADDGERAPADVSITSDAAREGVTRTRSLLGSPRYMAPEQLRSPRDVDVRADIWALGAILFEMLSGDPPFDGDTLDELRYAVTSTPVAALVGVPTELEAVVHRCLAKDPRHRFATVRELSQALGPWATPEGSRSVERIARLLRAPATVASPAFVKQESATEDATAHGARPRPFAKALGLIAILAIAWTALLSLGERDSAPSRAEAPPVAAIEIRPPPAELGETVRVPEGVASAFPPSLSTPTLPAVRAPSHGVRTTLRPAREPRRTVEEAGIDPSVTAPIASAPDPLRLDAGPMFNGRK